MPENGDFDAKQYIKNSHIRKHVIMKSTQRNPCNMHAKFGVNQLRHCQYTDQRKIQTIVKTAILKFCSSPQSASVFSHTPINMSMLDLACICISHLIINN